MATTKPELRMALGESAAYCPGTDSQGSCHQLGDCERQRRLLLARGHLAKAAVAAEARLTAAEELGRVGQRLLCQVLEMLALLSSVATSKQAEMQAVLADFTAEAAADLAALRSAMHHDADDDDQLQAVEAAAAEAAAAGPATRQSLQLHADNKELDTLLGLAMALDRIQLVVVAAPEDANPGGPPPPLAEQLQTSCEHEAVKIKQLQHQQPQMETKTTTLASRIMRVALLLLLCGSITAVACALLLAPDELEHWLTAAADHLWTWPPLLYEQAVPAT